MYKIWLIGFIFIVLAISIYFSRKVKTSDDYALAGGTLGFFPICGSIVATACGSFSIIGISGKGFTMGVPYLATNVGYWVFGILAAVLFGAAIRSLKLYTIPSLFSKRFGKDSALIPTFVVGILFLIPMFAVQLIGMARVMETTFGVNYNTGLVIGLVLCFAFTILGGMFSVAWTDAIQMIIIAFGVVLLFFATSNELGGVSAAIASTPKEYVDPFAIKFTDFISLFLIFGPLSLVYQTTWQRLSAAKNEKTAVRAVSLGFFLVFIMSVFTIYIGLFARQILPVGTAPDQVYTLMITKVLNPKIGGLFIVTLFSAILTTATSFLLSGATSIAKDVYTSWVNPNCTNEQLLKVLKYATLGMAVVGVVLALYVKDIFTISAYAKSVSAAILVFPSVAAFYWERATKKGVIASMISATVVTVIWKLAGDPIIDSVVPGMSISLIVLVVVSLMTEHSADEDVKAYALFFKKQKESEKVPISA